MANVQRSKSIHQSLQTDETRQLDPTTIPSRSTSTVRNNGATYAQRQKANFHFGQSLGDGTDILRAIKQ